MSFNIAVRVIGMALFGSAGFLLGIYLSPWIYGTDTESYNELAIYLTLFGAIFGLLMGALIASPAFETVARIAILVAILACIPLTIHSDRKRMGMFINGYRRGKTRIVVAGILIVELGLYFVSVTRGLEHGDHTTPLLLGVLGVVIGIAGSFLWQRVFVREMGV